MKTRGKAIWLVLAGLVVCFVFLSLVDRKAFVASVDAARHLRWGWVLIAAAVEVLSLVAAAEGHRRLLKAAGGRIGLHSVVAIGFASTAIAFSVPVAPLPFSASYSLRQYANRGIDVGLAAWALVILWMSATVALSLVLFAGAAASGSLVAAAGGLVASLVFLAPPLALLLALRFPAVRRLLTGRATRLAARVRLRSGGRLQRLFDRWPDPAAALDTVVARAGSLRVSVKTYAQVFVFSLCNWLLDVACLVLVIRATGSPVPWHGLLLAYGAGIVAGSIWPAPGGLGAVEAAMAAGLVAAGMQAGIALTAVLVYRLLSFWMLLGIGWVVMAVLARRREPVALAAL
ncbi:MAG: putative heme transporter [Actinomycetota bacterium]|nr:putative heme transporter [Actinomycetota bacterium]